MASKGIDDTLKEQESRLDGISKTLQQFQELMLSMDSRIEAISQRNVNNSDNHGQGILGPPPFRIDATSGSDVSHHLRSLRLELPRFDGSNPGEWIFCAEQFFNMYSTPEHLRLQIVAAYFEGSASTWYQWLQANGLLRSWKEFLVQLRQRFGASLFEDYQGQLAKLMQIHSVSKYQSEFELLSSKVSGISESLLISFYVNGLKPELKRELLIVQPTSLVQAMALSRVYEQKYHDIRALALKASGKHVFSTSLPTPFSQTHSSSSTIPLPKPKPTASHSSLPIKRLSPTELQEKREKGLCFNCDEKYGPQHRCKSKYLLLMGTDDDSSLYVQEDSDCHQLEELEDISEVSLNALTGQSNPQSLRVTGKYGAHVVNILIDNGSTHNFIRETTAHHLGLDLVTTKGFKVIEGNGDFILCQKKVADVELELQGHRFIIDLYALPIQGVEIVLGVQWLQTLGPILQDYNKMTMEFNWQDTRIQLHGSTSQKPLPVSFHQLTALLSHDHVSQLLYFVPTEVPPPTPEFQDLISDIKHRNLAEPFQSLLFEFIDVFAEPKGLPPHRTVDHRIHLEPGTRPITIRPYRYPHFQKTEMENLVQVMLDQGIIRDSNSPFSSLVLLVKKKDGSWRFCVDYRALNAVTVRDQYPIPTIDELFDELQDALIFSKLDLRSGYHQIRALMNKIFRPFLRQFVIFFFDDILDVQLFAKMSKCQFCQHTIDYLGHIVGSGKVQADPTKLEAMDNWPLPKTIKHLRGFLGLTGYYRRFIRGYATIAAPLTELLKKEAFVWSETATSAFVALKSAMMEALVLHLPNFSKVFVVETDASNVQDGILFYKGKLYLSSESPLCTSIIKEYHETPIGGHAGVARTLARVMANFFWSTMRQDVKEFVRRCSICQHVKYSTAPPYGLLQPLPIPDQVWDDLSLDFIVGLPQSKGYTVILVVVDRLSKYAHFGALPTYFTAVTVADLFNNMVVRLHGIPKSLVSDCDPIFTSQFWKRLFELQGTTLRMTSAYHPETDGQTEVLNRCLEDYLRAFVADTPHKWYSFLGWAEYSYNTALHSSIGMSPFKALYGREPPSIPSYLRGSSDNDSLDSTLSTRDAILRTLKECLHRAQNRMKIQADRHRKDLHLEPGSFVLVKLQPYRQISVAKRKNHKLSYRYFGPFHILERVGSVAYRLELPIDSKIHPVFHVSRLKPFEGPLPSDPPVLPTVVVGNKFVRFPLAVLAQRKLFRKGTLVPQILVQWSNSAPEDSTWVDFSNFVHEFPQLDLEDKVTFDGDGNDSILNIPIDNTMAQSVVRKWAENTEAHSEEIIADDSRELGNTDEIGKAPEAQEKETKKANQWEDQTVRTRKAPRWMKDYVPK
ncbi:uncharacterized protein [Primulina eburnea]|uniref:uncharacterized protein n=1 Tax=Primulina eburnea TaxID=1245227 RepID=UPI003C6CBA2E